MRNPAIATGWANGLELETRLGIELPPFTVDIGLLSILNYRTANCPCVAAPVYVGV